MFGQQFQGKRVWLSGHTGFKGSWLATWLIQLGASVHGFALEAEPVSLFRQLRLDAHLDHQVGDVRDGQLVVKSIAEAQPDFVFHLAAQPLVRTSYQSPVETYATNVMGTVHVLDALRFLDRPCSAVIVTTDKCYENREWLHSYREEDPLGGHDPYSSSKGAAEIAVAAFRRSFFPDSGPVAVGSVRAGNVIGGGDWAVDRIVPDCMRALLRQEPIQVRNRHATRPWQHVLEPLSGYLWLAAQMAQQPGSSRLRSAFNFGPALQSNRCVADLVTELLKHWPGSWVDHSDPNAPHEAQLLNLATDKAYHLLGWEPVWDFQSTIAETVKWYRAPENEAHQTTLQQLDDYTRAASIKALPWSADGR